MKRLLLFCLLAFTLFNCQFSIGHAQSWKNDLDSLKHYQSKQDFKRCLVYGNNVLSLIKNELGENDSSYIKMLGIMAEIYFNNNKPDSTILCQEKQVELYRKLIKGDDVLLAESINNLGYVHGLVKDYKKAQPFYLEALEMRRRIFKGEHRSLAQSLQNVASNLYDLGDKLNSEPYYMEALEMYRKVYKTDHPELADIIFKVANFQKEKGNYNLADTLYNESLEIRRRLYNGDHPKLANNLNSLALFYVDRADYKKAEKMFLESNQMYRRIFKGDHPDLAKHIHTLAFYYLNIGEYKVSEDLHKEYHDMIKRIFKSDHPLLAASFNNMGHFYTETGDATSALPFYKEGLEMRKRLFKKAHPDLAQSYKDIGYHYLGEGDYKNAEPMYKEGLKNFRQLYKSDHPELASSIISMGYFYESIGQYKLAEPFYIEGLAMNRRLYKNDNANLATSLNNMGMLLNSLNENEKAEQLLTEALEIRRRIFRGDHPKLAVSINNMGKVSYDLGKFKNASDYFKEALEMYRRYYKGKHYNIAMCLNNIAKSYNMLGKNDSVEDYFKESISMYKDVLSDTHPSVAICVNSFAKYYFERAEYKKAVNLFNEALSINKHILFDYFPSLSEKEKLQFWSYLSDYFEQYTTFTINMSHDNPVLINNIYENQLLFKSILLNSALKIKKRILQSSDTNITTNYKKWNGLKEKLSKTYKLSDDELKKKNIKLDSLENEINQIERDLSEKSEYFSHLTEKANYRKLDIQKELKQNEAAIEIIRYRQFDKKWKDSVYYAFLVLTKESERPDLIVIENGNDLENRYIKLFGEQIYKQRQKSFDSDGIEKVLKDLYAQFWAPVQKKLKGINTIYISLDGVYNQINLNALINPNTNKYLLDEIDLRVVTSTRDLANNGRVSSNQKNEKNEVVLFGDPQFDLDSNKYKELVSNFANNQTRDYYFFSNILDSTTRGMISRLPGTKIEIETIGSEFEKKDWIVKKYTGAEALEEAVKSLHSPRVLHIATHGKFLKDIEVTNDEKILGFEIQKFSENPLLRSMLLLAGAENSIKEGTQSNDRDDGLLTAYEAQNLNLDNTELVVLSACETALGEIKNGEGVYGLQRAFQVAGAKSLIMSLWSVSDQATQELMTSFYTKWLSGKSKREAFREAQSKLKDKYPGFYYWGAFVMVGE